MAYIRVDRVMETSTTTGVGALTLAGAVAGFRTFASVCAVSDTAHYVIEGVDSGGVPTGEWETGLGTYSGVNTLTRTTVIASSNGGAAVNFSAGTKRVFISHIAASVVSKLGDTMTGQLNITVTGANNLIIKGESSTAFVGDRYSADASAPNFAVRKARGTIASPAVIIQNDQSGVYSMQAYDGATFRSTVTQTGIVVAATPSSTDMESEWRLQMPGPGSVSLTEVLRAKVGSGLSMYGANIVIDQDRLHRMRNYTVATLPAAGTAGRHAYASNCRMFDSVGVQEGAGAGTGGLVTDNGTAWKIAGTNVTAIA